MTPQEKQAICGGGLLITKELITTTIGERWFTKQVCMNRKTSGCL